MDVVTWSGGSVVGRGHSGEKKVVDILDSIDSDDSEIPTATEESSEDVEESKNLS